jgi:hypothetical protein
MNITSLVNAYKAIRDRNSALRQPDRLAEKDAAARIGAEVAQAFSEYKLIDQKVRLINGSDGLLLRLVAEGSGALRIEFDDQPLHHLYIELFDKQVQIRSYTASREDAGEQLYLGHV